MDKAYVHDTLYHWYSTYDQSGWLLYICLTRLSQPNYHKLLMPYRINFSAKEVCGLKGYHPPPFCGFKVVRRKKQRTVFRSKIVTYTIGVPNDFSEFYMFISLWMCGPRNFKWFLHNFDKDNWNIVLKKVEDILTIILKSLR